MLVFCCQVWSWGGGGGLLRENHDTVSQEQQREGVREKLRERKSGSSHSVMERGGGWLTTHCTGCLEHHGNKEREGLREAEVQGLHLFQQHFNYFGHRRLEKQMRSRAPATTGRNPKRLWCLSFLFFFSLLLFSPPLIFVKLLQQLEIRRDYRSRLIMREGDGDGEKERRVERKSNSTRKMNEKGDEAKWTQIEIDSIGDTSCLKEEVGKRYEEKGPREKGLGGICRDIKASVVSF